MEADSDPFCEDTSEDALEPPKKKRRYGSPVKKRPNLPTKLGGPQANIEEKETTNPEAHSGEVCRDSRSILTAKDDTA